MKSRLNLGIAHENDGEVMEKRKIFIVEDDLVLLETLQDILSQFGFDCKGCNDAAVASHMIEAYRPDLILLDYMLPDWNGGELCSAIRGIEGFEYVPIIITSAYAKILFSASEFGCDAVLEKPFEISKLISLINDMLTTRRSDSGLMPKIKRLIQTVSPKLRT